MRKKSRVMCTDLRAARWAALALCFTSATFPVNGRTANAVAPSSVVPGEYLIRRAPGQSTEALVSSLKGKWGTDVEVVDEIAARRLVQVRVPALTLGPSPELAAKLTSTAGSAATLQAVDSIEPVIRYHLADAPTDVTRAQLAMSEVMKRIKLSVSPIKPLTISSSAVIVAVIDSGVFSGHEVFKGLILPGTDVTKPSAHSTADPVTLPTGAIEYHGTATAGLIAEVIRGGTLSGPPVGNIKILPIRATSADETVDSGSAIKAIDYAISQGASVINCSWGNGPDSKELRQALADAGAANITVVTSAGNGRAASSVDPPVGYDIDAEPFFPASYQLPNMVSVAALGVSTALAGFSNWGLKTVLLAAPGDSIMAPVPDRDDPSQPMRSGYLAQSGTSLSAPLVAAAVAIYRAGHPLQKPAEIVARVGRSASQQVELAHRVSSGGVLSVEDLLAQAGTPIVAANQEAPTVGAAETPFAPVTQSMLESFASFQGVPADAPTLKGRDNNGSHVSTPNVVDFLVRFDPGSEPATVLADLPATQGTVRSVDPVRPDLYSVKVDAPAGSKSVELGLRSITGVKSVEKSGAYELLDH
jgi:hypothetical protein